MPFVKKTDAKDTQHPTEIRKLFIGRVEELHFFREHILKPEDAACNIVSISGQGGVGKSTLLLRFIDDAHATDFKDYCLTALVNERQATAADVIETFAEQLHLEGDFEKALRQYKEVLRKIQSQREAAHEALTRQITTDMVSSVVKDVPFVGSILKEGVGVAANYVFGELHYRQLLKDAERLEDPLGDLTKAFVTELNKLTESYATVSSSQKKKKRRVILFFDTFEQLAAESAPWLLDYFLEAEISSNVVLVIAGRDSLENALPGDPKRWLPYFDTNTIYSISLDSFTLEETRNYLAERGITENDRIEAIWHLSHGLPLYLGFLTSNPHGKVDPTANVVTNFLRWIPEQEQVKRRLALDSSLFSRSFNQDELSAFSYVTEQERPSLFRWLTIQPFVQSNLQDGRYSYHELAQELFSRHLYQLTPIQYRTTRMNLSEHYRILLRNIETEGGKNAYTSPQWLELTLALAHQLFLLPDEVNHLKAAEQILTAHAHAEQDGEIIKTLKDMLKNQSHFLTSSGSQRMMEQLLYYIETDDEKQEFLQAANYLLERLAHEPSFSQELLVLLYQNRGRAYRILKDYEQALADFGRAIELEPNNESAHYWRGRVYFDLKDYEQALADFGRAIELEPNYAFNYNWRGNVYYTLKDYEQALADFGRAIELEPTDAFNYNWRGNVYSDLKDYEQALADFGRAIELKPNYASAHYWRGNVYYTLKDYEQALADFGRAIELDPNYASAYNRRSIVYDRLKDYERELVDNNRAIELDPTVAVYYYNRARTYYDLKDHEQALADFGRAIELDPTDADYYNQRGKVYYGLKDYERALADYEQALKLSPYDSDFYNDKERALRQIRDDEQIIS